MEAGKGLGEHLRSRGTEGVIGMMKAKDKRRMKEKSGKERRREEGWERKGEEEGK